MLIINIYKKFGRKIKKILFLFFFLILFLFRHPFLLYPHFIDHWKKRFNKDDDSLIDDNDLDIFSDDEEDIERNKKKSKNKQNKVLSFQFKIFMKCHISQNLEMH